MNESVFQRTDSRGRWGTIPLISTFVTKNRTIEMKSTSVLLPVLRPSLFICLTYTLTLAGTVGAQTPGPGQVGGMGQGGAPAGEFPSDRGNVTYGQRYTPAEDFPAEPLPENKDMNEDKSKNTSGDSRGNSPAETSRQSGKRGVEGKADTPAGSAIP
jgi:hypothetical protein